MFNIYLFLSTYNTPFLRIFTIRRVRVSASPDAKNLKLPFTGLRKISKLRYETQELLPFYQPFIGWEDFYQFAIDGDFFAMKVGDEEEVVASGLS